MTEIEVTYEQVVRFIESSYTALPALLAKVSQAAKIKQCFKSDLAQIRYVATAIEQVDIEKEPI